MPFDLVIRGGTIVGAADTFVADIAVQRGRVAAVGRITASARKTLDARGKVLVPGAVACLPSLADARASLHAGVTTVLARAPGTKGPRLCAADHAFLERGEKACAAPNHYALWDEVQNRRITENRFVELTAARTARRYGLYPRKGHLNCGADADIVIIDPNRPHAMSSSRTVKGRIETVLLRGIPVVREGRRVGRSLRGRLLRRTTR